MWVIVFRIIMRKDIAISVYRTNADCKQLRILSVKSMPSSFINYIHLSHAKKQVKSRLQSGHGRIHFVPFLLMYDVVIPGL